MEARSVYETPNPSLVVAPTNPGTTNTVNGITSSGAATGLRTAQTEASNTSVMPAVPGYVWDPNQNIYVPSAGQPDATQYANENASYINVPGIGVTFSGLSQDPGLEVTDANYQLAHGDWLSEFGDLLTPVAAAITGTPTPTPTPPTVPPPPTTGTGTGGTTGTGGGGTTTGTGGGDTGGGTTTTGNGSTTTTTPVDNGTAFLTGLASLLGAVTPGGGGGTAPVQPPTISGGTTTSSGAPASGSPTPLILIGLGVAGGIWYFTRKKKAQEPPEKPEATAE